MFATLTSKGQVTLPKEIRDRLGLDAGSMLDFQILEDNTITARRVLPDARRIRGLLKSPHAIPLTVEQMDEAVSKHLRDRHAPSAWQSDAQANTLRPCLSTTGSSFSAMPLGRLVPASHFCTVDSLVFRKRANTG